MLHLGQVEHVGHHARQALQLLDIGGQHVAVAGGVARLRERHLGLRHQAGQRRAQFVGKVRREFGQPAEVVLQAGQHRVQVGGQRGHLDGHGLHGHALVELVAGNGLGARGHRTQRRQPAPRRPPAEEPARQHRQRHVEHQRAAERAQEMLVDIGVHRQDHADGLGGIAGRHRCAQAPVALAGLLPGEAVFAVLADWPGGQRRREVEIRRGVAGAAIGLAQVE
ncbi:hypothetical protein D3C87_1060150 [compost metagenome]